METSELNEAKLAAHVKDACAAPATPKKDVEDAVWRRVNKKLDRKHETKVLTPATPRRMGRWWMVASTVAAALMIATLLMFRGDPSWEMAQVPHRIVTTNCEKSALSSERSVTTPHAAASDGKSDDLIPLPIEMPEPGFIGTPKALPKGEWLAPESSGTKMPVDTRMPPMAPPDKFKNAATDSGDHCETASDMDFAGKTRETDSISDVPSSRLRNIDAIGIGGDIGSYRQSQRRQAGESMLTPPPIESKDAKINESAASSRDKAQIGKKKTDDYFEEAPVGRNERRITPPAITSGETNGVKDASPVAGPTTRSVSRPVVAPVPVPEAKPARKLGAEPVDTRGKREIEELRAKAAELERKIADVEASDKQGPVAPNPYANLQEIKPNVQVLSGGTQDDNVEFGKFQSFLAQTNAPEAIKQDISERVMIEVSDLQGLPLTNADVRIVSNGRTIHKARTYSNGMALFHPRVVGADSQSQDFRVEVVPPPGCSGQTVAQDFRGRSGTWRIQVPYSRPQTAAKLDILLCLDCTGSMADEIERIQKTLQMMVAKFNALPGKPQTRWGLVQFRDRQDRYVTQVHDFTEDVATFQKRLDACKADAGGDEPESVNEALDKSVEGVSWERSDAIRLVFLVGDAPPHMDYANDVKYTESMAKAQRRAIKIYPLAASGLNKTGEVIFRQLAQYTLARFLFISYGGGTSHEVSNPGQSNNLDDLIVHIVANEVNARVTPIRAPFQIEDPDRWQK